MCTGHIIFDCDGTLKKDFSRDFFEDIPILLKELDHLGLKLYVWTARYKASLVSILEYNKVIHYFSDFHCPNDGPTKPSIDGPQSLVGGKDKSKILHIGDSITDIQGAKAFGISVIAALWNPNVDEIGLLSLSPDYIARKPIECLDIIKKKFNC